jgi:RNA polymerase sigma-70 factor (ECF subfamily)
VVNGATLDVKVEVEVEVDGLADPEQFLVFYAAALPRVYGYFYGRLGANRTAAEDLTQETFLAAVAEIRRGTAIVAPTPWVLGIARHKLLDHFRRQKRAGWALLSWEIDVDEEALFVPEDDETARDQAIAALALVPSPQREALVLRYLDGLSVPEVAAALERSVAAAESLLARGRVAFRRGFQEASHGL